MKMDVALAGISDAAEANGPRSPADGAKQAQQKVRFAAAMSRARGEGAAKESGGKDADTAETTVDEPEGKTRKKRTSGVPDAMLPFDVTVGPETRMALLSEAGASTAPPRPGLAGAREPAKVAPVLGELTPSVPGVVPAEVPERAQSQPEPPGAPKARAVAAETPEMAKPEQPSLRETKDERRVLAKPVERHQADAGPDTAKTDTKPVPAAARTAPRAEPPAAGRPAAAQQAAHGVTAREAQPKAAERDAETVAEKPRAVRAGTTPAKPIVALADFTPLRGPAAVAMQPEVVAALPREMVEPTPMLTAANLAQAVVTLPDLGRIEIRSRMQDGALEVDLRADRPAGRAALENAREALTVQIAAIAPVAQLVVGPTQVHAADGPRPGHEGLLSDSSQQSRDSGGRDSSGGSRERGGRHEESRPVAQVPRGRVRIVL